MMSATPIVVCDFVSVFPALVEKVSLGLQTYLKQNMAGHVVFAVGPVGYRNRVTEKLECEFHETASSAEVAVSEFVQNRPSMVKYVFSYRQTVLQAAQNTANNVFTAHLGNLLHEKSTVSGAPQEAVESAGWAWSHIGTEKRGLELMCQVLQNARAIDRSSAIYMTGLRSSMALLDTTWSGKAIATRSKGMMTHLVKTAVKRGLVCEESAENNAFVWLSPSQRDRTSQEEDTPRGNEKPLQTRADEIQKSLQDDGWGPYSTVRHAAYDAIDQLFTTPCSLIDLVSKVAPIAKEELGRRGLDASNQNWQRIEDFLIRLLPASGSILADGGNAIRPNWDNLNAEICSLADDWQMRADAFLVLQLVNREGILFQRELRDLTGVLFHNRNNESLARTHRLVTFLIDSGAVFSREEDGHLVVENMRRIDESGGSQVDRPVKSNGDSVAEDNEAEHIDN